MERATTLIDLNPDLLKSIFTFFEKYKIEIESDTVKDEVRKKYCMYPGEDDLDLVACVRLSKLGNVYMTCKGFAMILTHEMLTFRNERDKFWNQCAQACNDRILKGGLGNWNCHHSVLMLGGHAVVKVSLSEFRLTVSIIDDITQVYEPKATGKYEPGTFVSTFVSKKLTLPIPKMYSRPLTDEETLTVQSWVKAQVFADVIPKLFEFARTKRAAAPFAKRQIFQFFDFE